jgi:hypothetical protein
MADIITTSFEDYADGASLPANGWILGTGDHVVVSSGARTGTKCVDVPDGTGAMQWNTLVGGRYVTIGYSCNVDSTGGVFGPPLAGPNLQIASSLGSDGITRWPIQLFAFGSTDVQLYIFDVLVATAAGVVVYDQYQTWRMEVRLSTVNAGGTDVNPDGCVKVYRDGGLIISAAGLRIAVTSTQWASGVNYWDQLYFDIGCGKIDDVVGTTDVVTCPSAVGNPPPTSNPCCGSEPPSVPPGPPGTTPEPGTPPGSQPGPVEPPNPFIPLPSWTPECAGGGSVPTAADEVDSESWVH